MWRKSKAASALCLGRHAITVYDCVLKSIGTRVYHMHPHSVVSTVTVPHENTCCTRAGCCQLSGVASLQRRMGGVRRTSPVLDATSGAARERGRQTKPAGTHQPQRSPGQRILCTRDATHTRDGSISRPQTHRGRALSHPLPTLQLYSRTRTPRRPQKPQAARLRATDYSCGPANCR